MKIAYNKRTAEFLIEAWLYNLNDYINTENKLTPNQITEIAKLFYDKAYYLNLPEIVLLFKKIRMGEYGKIYGSFCGIDFFNSLNHFLKDRIIAYNKLSSEKQIQKIQKEHPLTINGYFSQK